MNLLLFKKDYKTGTCSYMFLIIYGIFRIFSEFFREPDSQIGFIFGNLSMGMLLSLFMILLVQFFILKKMTYNPGYFNLKHKKLIPIDEFIETVLYEPNTGYYTKKFHLEAKAILLQHQQFQIYFLK